MGYPCYSLTFFQGQYLFDPIAFGEECFCLCCLSRSRTAAATGLSREDGVRCLRASPHRPSRSPNLIQRLAPLLSIRIIRVLCGPPSLSPPAPALQSSANYSFDVESNSRTHAPSSAISGSGNDLDPIQLRCCSAYLAAELRTFHCERGRKMAMSGLHPSMLIGFLVRDGKHWRDFRRRVGEEVVEVQDEDDDEGESEQFFEMRSRSASSASNAGQESSRRGSRQSEDVDTEEDPVGPMTPGPGSKFDIVLPPRREDDDGFGEDDEEEEESDIEDDWVDPSLPTYTDWAAPATSDDNSVEPETEERAVCCIIVIVSALVVEPASVGQRQGFFEHYPFPVTAAPPDDNDNYSFASNSETSSSVGAPRYTRDGRTRNVSMKGGAQAQGQGQHRMHNARARDGGRTQSGGVKGILTDS
ncbi:hypothetical protein CPC08DRAFT_805092 [Agrocybe pediades]|nr:hypothetical protein CPC08DRAFT_805092 [Agrocybe pediades]